MATPRFSTLFAQAQKIVKSDLELAANFFASGMAFRLREPSGYDNEGLRDILKDVACYEEYLECSVRKSKYQQELLEQLKQNPTAYHKLFNEGYLYECDILSKQEKKTAQQTTEEQDIEEKPRVGLYRVKGGYIYSAIPNAVAESAIIEISYQSYCLFAEDNSPRAMIIKDNANHVYLMHYHKRYTEGLGTLVFSCFEHFDYTELYEDLDCSSNNKLAFLVFLRNNKYGMIAVGNIEDGTTEVIERIPCEYDTMEEVENEILKMIDWDMNQPKPFDWVDNIYTAQEALKDDDLSDCINDMLHGEYKPSRRITFPENLSHESSAEDLCKAMWNNEDFKKEVLKEYKRIMALKAFFEDDSGQDGGPSEDVVQAARDAYGYTLGDLTLLDNDEPLD